MCFCDCWVLKYCNKKIQLSGYKSWFLESGGPVRAMGKGRGCEEFFSM
jgi:hypothetical protein